MWKWFIGVIGIFIVIVIFVNSRTYTTTSANENPINFTVQKGDDLITVGSKLAQEQLIANRIYFYYYAWKNKLRGLIHAGEYTIEPGSSIEEIVQKMISGDSVIQKHDDIKITFPEGWTMKQMSNRLNNNNLPGDEFLKLAQNPPKSLYEHYSFLEDGKSLEGFLFPDTYFFAYNTSSEDIIKKMLDNFDQKVDISRRQIIKEQGRDLYDVIIFASIIEGEVPSNADRGIVAGIFKNRLDIGMALQSDATIDYIKGTPEIKHTAEDINIDSPYNTYKYPGLPPGPINNPSLESIDAAIAPLETEYMYFLNHVETGETIFSKTLQEHVSNKQKSGL